MIAPRRTGDMQRHVPGTKPTLSLFVNVLCRWPEARGGVV